MLPLAGKNPSILYIAQQLTRNILLPEQQHLFTLPPHHHHTKMTDQKSKVWSSSPTRSILVGCYGGTGIQPGFSQAADNRMYSELRRAVLASEKERCISLGLPPEPPKGMTRFKNWILNRQEQSVGTGASNVSGEEIKKP